MARYGKKDEESNESDEGYEFAEEQKPQPIKKVVQDEDEGKKTSRFELVEVPVQMKLAIRDNKNNSFFDVEAALVEILNEVHEIRKRV